jgi:hypothetical protein
MRFFEKYLDVFILMTWLKEVNDKWSEAGRNMGKAAAAYYKEMKEGGLPEQVAVKLTEDYMRTFSA